MSEPALRTQKVQRNYSLDILRIVAICFVVMIHSSSKFVENANYETGFIIGNIFNGISRAGVPLFLMISGALNLDERKEKSLKDVFASVKNIFFLTVTWSGFYAVIYQIIQPLQRGEKVFFYPFLKAFLEGNYHLWYLYMLMGLYLATPFLRCFVKKENKNLVNLYILIAVIFRFITPVVELLSMSNKKILVINSFLDGFEMDFFSVYITYYLLGWYIIHVGFNKDWIKKLIYVLGFASIVSALISSLVTKNYADAYSNGGIFVFVYSISIFSFVSSRKLENIEKSKKFIVMLSSLSFGVYVIHAYINAHVYVALSGLHPVAHILLQFAIVIVSSFAICYVMSKIPIIKKSIRG